jgi:putative transposase
MDEDTRECLSLHVERRIDTRKVWQIMAGLIQEHGAPERIRSDNGSECIERGLRRALSENKIKTLYIEPGSPWQSGYIESCNAR